MTELEFQNTDPTKYNEGNCNLLYSSSISTGSFDLPSNYPTGSSSPTESGGVYYLDGAFFPPYTILGLTIPNNSTNDVSVEQTLQSVKAVKFTFAGTVVSLKVLGISKRSNYYYLRTQPRIVNTFPEGRDQSDIPLISGLEFIFTPFLKEKFSNSDYNALIGNATTQRSNGAVQVDRLVGQASPSNYHALVSGSASPAAVQYSNYTITGLSNARYSGTKLQSGSVEGEDPAMGLRSFTGIINELDSKNVTILAQSEGSKDIYFTIDRKPTAYFRSTDVFNNFTGSSFPTPGNLGGGQNGSILYEEDGNRFVRIVNKKVHAIDRGSIFITDENGRSKGEETS
tara:strand:- start:3442 stop:4464 length:1023 start_codon:yes stop_codon:yes gene_type:complete